MSIIYKEEGFKVLFSGVVPRTIWISLGGAIFFGAYEAAKQLMGIRESGKKIRED